MEVRIGNTAAPILVTGGTGTLGRPVVARVSSSAGVDAPAPLAPLRRGPGDRARAPVREGARRTDRATLRPTFYTPGW